MSEIKVGSKFESVNLSELENGYYYVESSHLQIDDFGMSMQRIIIEKDGPYAMFIGSETYENVENIQGTFVKLNVEQP